MGVGLGLFLLMFLIGFISIDGLVFAGILVVGGLLAMMKGLMDL